MNPDVVKPFCATPVGQASEEQMRPLAEGREPVGIDPRELTGRNWRRVQRPRKSKLFRA